MIIKKIFQRSMNKPYVIVRTDSAGVFAGYLKSRKDRKVVLTRARRIWYWEGAASLSQLAMEGVGRPDACKFPCEVDKVELLEAIEILYVTEVAKESIAAVPIWEYKDSATEKSDVRIKIGDAL